MFAFKFKKTSGIRVDYLTFKLIKSANTLRDQKNYAKSARLFEKSLLRDSSLVHIWVQLGHMKRESGDRIGAANAYVEAFLRNPTDPDANFYCIEYMFISRYDLKSRATDIILERNFSSLLPYLNNKEYLNRRIFFDATDLVQHFTHKRTPTGIQRVQSEVIKAAITRAYGMVGVCVYKPASQSWSHIPNDFFVNLLNAAEQGTDTSDTVWQEQFQKFRAFLSLTGDMPFPTGSSIVSLGAGWNLHSFFDKISELKKKFNVQHIAAIHDLIPIFKPEYFVNSLVSDFAQWLKSLVVISDKIITVSKNTKNDLERYCKLSHVTDRNKNVYVMPLDVAISFKEKENEQLSSSDIDLPDNFVLFVSTIEIRKGHLLAAQAWKRLLARYGERTPNLLCIGSAGWKADAFWKFLEENPDVSKKITIISKATDHILFHAYRKCIFTIYPSHYEGWGLPIVESLCLKKVPIIADNSSLSEAGGSFGLYFKTGDAISLSDSIENLAFHPSLRHQMEQNIAEKFSPRSWGDLAEQIMRITADKQEGQSR